MSAAALPILPGPRTQATLRARPRLVALSVMARISTTKPPDLLRSLPDLREATTFGDRPPWTMVSRRLEREALIERAKRPSALRRGPGVSRRIDYLVTSCFARVSVVATASALLTAPAALTPGPAAQI